MTTEEEKLQAAKVALDAAEAAYEAALEAKAAYKAAYEDAYYAAEDAEKAAIETGDDAAYEAAAYVFEATLRSGYKNILNKLRTKIKQNDITNTKKTTSKS